MESETDDLAHITGNVLDAGLPVVGVEVRLYDPENRYASTSTDEDGFFEFWVPVMSDCSIQIRHEERRLRFTIDCTTDNHYTLDIPPPSTPTTTAPRTSSNVDSVAITGSVVHANNGAPMAGVAVRAEGPAGNESATTSSDGSFALDLAPGPYEFGVELTCFLAYEARIDVEDGLELFVRLRPEPPRVPEVPAGVRGTPGPGAGQVTISWDRPDDECGSIQRYRLYRGATPDSLQPFLRLGNTYAVSDSSRTDDSAYHYAVAAVSRAGQEGPLSAVLAADPLVAGPPAMEAPPRTPTGITVEEREFPVFDAEWNPVGTRTWRVVAGSGALAENYLTTTESGRILDLGGVFLRFSDDRGLTWKEVSVPFPFTGGEGAVAPAPNGDIVAVGWSLIADHVWAHRYSATDDTWYYQPIPHMPFFDRPWIGTIKGPFHVGDIVVPYVTIVRSSYANGFTAFISYDGLTYARLDPPAASLALSERTDLPDSFSPDPERDWTQPLQYARTADLGDGMGYFFVGGVGTCSGWFFFQQDMSWSCPGGRAAIAASDHPVVDSEGRLHHVRFDYNGPSVRYRISMDAGRAWTDVDVPLPPGWSVTELDFKVYAAQGQTVINVHALTDRPGAPHQDLVYRYDLRKGGPVLREILVLGKGDVNYGGDVTATGNPRFDFSNVAFLPDGKIVVSFADSTATRTQAAVER